MMKFMIALDLGIIHIHFWSTKKSKNLTVSTYFTCTSMEWSAITHSAEDHFSLPPHTMAIHQFDLDCMSFSFISGAHYFLWPGLFDIAWLLLLSVMVLLMPGKNLGLNTVEIVQLKIDGEGLALHPFYKMRSVILSGWFSTGIQTYSSRLPEYCSGGLLVIITEYHLLWV